MRLFPNPIILVIVFGIVAAALVVWFIAEAKVGWIG
jgi:hypothetical protein